MKKRSGKLSLNRETLRKLELHGLRQAAGGTTGPDATSNACMGTCSCPSASCHTWGSC